MSIPCVCVCACVCTHGAGSVCAHTCTSLSEERNSVSARFPCEGVDEVRTFCRVTDHQKRLEEESQ